MFSLFIIFCYTLIAVSPFKHERIGYSFDSPWNKIIGGFPAVEKQFPYQVSLQRGRSSHSVSHFCGGSIINRKWIITAAHCPQAVHKDYEHFVVKAGIYKLSGKDPNEQVSTVKKSYLHDQYRGGVAPFDLALLLLEDPLEFNEYVQPINLPKPKVNHYGNVTLSGWGSVTPRDVRYLIPDNLQFAILPVIDLETCEKALSDMFGTSDPLHPTNICTGPLTGGFSACAGDSGGPLVQTNPESKEVELVGIVSWGVVPCGTVGAPSVYTKASEYTDWIALTMSNE